MVRVLRVGDRVQRLPRSGPGLRLCLCLGLVRDRDKDILDGYAAKTRKGV
jgi:hypothetical protein